MCVVHVNLVQVVISDSMDGDNDDDHKAGKQTISQKAKENLTKRWAIVVLVLVIGLVKATKQNQPTTIIINF